MHSFDTLRFTKSAMFKSRLHETTIKYTLSLIETSAYQLNIGIQSAGMSTGTVKVCIRIN